MLSYLRLKRKQKNSSKPFRIRLFLFLSYLFGIETINTFIHSVVPSKTIPDSRASVDPFSDQNGAKTLPDGAAHIYMAYMREPPSPGPKKPCFCAPFHSNSLHIVLGTPSFKTLSIHNFYLYLHSNSYLLYKLHTEKPKRHHDVLKTFACFRTDCLKESTPSFLRDNGPSCCEAHEFRRMSQWISFVECVRHIVNPSTAILDFEKR